MEKFKKIIFFQPIISIHQLPLLNEISSQGHDVTLVAFNTNKLREQTSGWSDKGISKNIKLILTPSKDDINRLLENEDKAEIIISGFCICSNTRYIMSQVRKKNMSVYIYSEGGNISSFLLPLRLFKNIYYRHRYEKYISGVFTIGAKGYDWFSRIGFKKSRLIDFLYFTELCSHDFKKRLMVRADYGSRANIVFLGRLVEGKGLRKLLEYGERLDESTHEINIYGDGPLLAELREYADKNSLTTMINFHGLIKHKELEKVFEEATVLCLLNDGDEGWGAVVNESLLHGTPVICTPKTGASSIVRKQSGFGVVLESDDFPQFNAALTHCQTLDRKVVLETAEKILSPLSGALKFINSLEKNDNY
ncbi:glycosyltransferase family 4 protein [Vibrio parahaemolyticus]